MARKKESEQLTPLELEIMKVLWEGGPSTVQAVQQRLPPERTLAYTTVQTMLNVLHRKGKVRQTMGDIIDRFFEGSAESLVLSLVETRRLTPGKLAELSRLIEQSRETPDGKD